MTTNVTVKAHNHECEVVVIDANGNETVEATLRDGQEHRTHVTDTRAVLVRETGVKSNA